ncbi:sortase [Butyrivibrio sp. CB08]|uniref:sortase n=1 Tax=Butyrivibrio sp. CB08 TaxID=2364879 RepID=UPI000EA99279|nr:sortase [Butyrivibrio sp. CB08]RKM61182.1 sortase [Butyrivibrio sp. CB08]
MKKISGYIYIAIGALLIIIAAVIVKNNFDENAKAGAASDELLQGVIEQMPEVAIGTHFKGAMPIADVDGRSFVGTVQIPSLGLILPIQDQWSKENAKVAICRYSGSVYENDLIVCGHNYVEHFGRLPELEIGSDVIVTDMNGISFHFVVSNIETLGAYDTEKMESGQWDFTMFTCTVGGSNRVTVRCEATGEVTDAGSEPDILKAVEESKHIRKTN